MQDDTIDLLLAKEAMDQGEHSKEVYAQFGLAIYMAQVLEHAIVNALMCCDLIPNRRRQVPSREEWTDEVDRFMDDHFENTMGKMIKAFHKVTNVPVELEQNLEQSLKTRNVLVHSYFRERVEFWLTEKGRDAMIVELQAARDLFKKNRLTYGPSR